VVLGIFSIMILLFHNIYINVYKLIYIYDHNSFICYKYFNIYIFDFVGNNIFILCILIICIYNLFQFLVLLGNFFIVGISIHGRILIFVFSHKKIFKLQCFLYIFGKNMDNIYYLFWILFIKY
jgi:hypothetical protein